MDRITVGEHEYYWDGRYYARHRGLATPRRLHVDVWEAHNGSVPAGYHVHHIDEDRRNNEINNLQLVDGAEHVRAHSSTEKAKEHMRTIQHLGKEAAKAWHKSEEGTKWHKEHFDALMASRGILQCAECSSKFKPTNFRQKFCCKRCNNRAKMRAWRVRQKEACTTKLDS